MTISIDHPNFAVPDSIDSLFLWLNTDNDSLITLRQPGNRINAWQSTYNPNRKVYESGNAPIYYELPSPAHAKFERDRREHLINNFTIPNTSYTMFFVARMDKNIVTNTHYTLISFNEKDGDFISVGAKGNIPSAFYTNEEGNTISYTSTSFTVNDTLLHIFSFTWNRSGSNTFEFGYDGNTSNPVQCPYSLSRLIEAMLGGCGEAGDNIFGNWDGDIAEVLVYNRILTDLEIEKIEGYLGSKFSIPLGK
jgi:hypothetical protein